jgi:hypothetical protein
MFKENTATDCSKKEKTKKNIQNPKTQKQQSYYTIFSLM